MKNRSNVVRLVALMLALALAFSLAACGSKPTEPETQSAGATETEAAVSSEAAEDETTAPAEEVPVKPIGELSIIGPLPGTLDGGNHGHLWSAASYECLVAKNPDGTTYGQLVDDSKGTDGHYYEHKAGTDYYDVHLYEYIVDTNNNPLTADDVVFSYNWHIENGKARGFTYLDHVEAVDTYTVRFCMTEEIEKLAGLDTYFTSIRCFTQKSFEDNGSSFASSMVGTGPYAIAEFIPDVSITLEKKDNYWQKEELIKPQNAANVDRIIINKSGETAQSIIALQTGTASVLENLSFMNAAPFLEGGENFGKFNTELIEGSNIYTLFPNVSEDSPMNDINLRLAVWYALDGDQLTAAMGSGVGTRSSAWAMPNNSDYDPELENIQSYITETNVEKAKEYLAKSGYKSDTKLRILYGNFDGNFSTISNVVLNMLNSIGIQGEILAYDMANFGAIHEDPTAWDIWITTWSDSTGYNAVGWFDTMDYNNRKENGTTQFFAHDEEMQKVIKPMVLPETHDAENMKKAYQYFLDKAYMFPICSVKTVSVYSLDINPDSVILSQNGSIMVNALSAK